MTLSSLNDLHEDILNRVFYFAPSVYQLLHIKKTNARFNRLTEKYFKILKVIDFRSPLKVDEYLPFETKWCSDDCVKIITEEQSNISYEPILPKFEGEFLEKLRSEYDAKLSQGLDMGEIQEDLGCISGFKEFYRSLHTKTKKSGSNCYKVFKRQRKLTHNLTTLSYLYRYLVSLPDYAHFIQDYKAVEQLTVSINYASSWFDDIKNIVTLFSGLKYLVLKIVDYKRVSDHIEAIQDYFTDSKIQLEFDFQDCCGITDQVLAKPKLFEKLSRNITSWLIPLGCQHVESSPFRFVKYLNTSLCDSEGFLRARPSLDTVEHLTMPRVDPLMADYVSSQLEKDGSSLKYLFFKVYIRREEEVELMDSSLGRLYEVIANRCTNLRKLLVTVPYDSATHANNLKTLLTKIGHRLTVLQVGEYVPDDGLVDVIACHCKKLKYLNLNLQLYNKRKEEVYASLKQLNALKMCKLKLQNFRLWHFFRRFS